MKRKAVRDKAFAPKTIASAHDLALGEADSLGDRGISPERAPVAVGRQVEKEKERDLLQCQTVKNVAQAVIDPGEVRRQHTHPRRVDRLTVRKRCPHNRRSLSVAAESKT